MIQDEKSDSSDVLKRARDRFMLASEAEQQLRKEATEDLKFFGGDQWPEDVKTARELDKRPCLTINLLPKFVRQVTNEQRLNRPAIKVNPVDDEGDVDTAEVYQGLVRHIEYDSNAEVAYDTASDYQARCGFGYFRIITEYCNPMSFEQKIMIKRIRDPFSVYLDPNYMEPDGSDAMWGFVVDNISKDQYREMFPDSDLSQMHDWSPVDGGTQVWMQKGQCQIAEYYEKTFKDVTIVKLDDGRVVRKDKIPKELLDVIEGNAPAPFGVQIPQIVEERKTRIPVVTWYKINGIEILDETPVLGSYIPIIPVLGDELFMNGEKTLESVVRHAKDPQRMYNYWETAKTEMIALAPKAPFIGVEGQFDGFESQWQNANVKTQPFLQYRMVTGPGGQPMPPPMRQVYEPPIQAMSVAAQTSQADIMQTTGIFSAELGEQSNEQSGKAIERRTQQSNTSNLHYGDNFKRSLRHAGRIIVEWIPEVYTGPQAVRVLGADGQQKIVKINQMFMKNGKETIYDLNKGEYDVTIDTGPSFQTKRQEGTAAMLDLARTVPDTMKYGLDILVSDMDWSKSKELAERLRKLLPPGLAEDNNDEKPQVPPEAQAAMMKMQQMLQQQSQLIGQQDEVIRTKKLELESKERIELEKIKADILIEQMKIDTSHAQLGFVTEVKDIHKRLDLLHANQPIIQNDGSGPSAAESSMTNQQPPGGSSPA